jgi:hypothetical protein
MIFFSHDGHVPSEFGSDIFRKESKVLQHCSPSVYLRCFCRSCTNYCSHACKNTEINIIGKLIQRYLCKTYRCGIFPEVSAAECLRKCDCSISIVTTLVAGWTCFYYRYAQKVFNLIIVSKPALWRLQPLVQWVPWLYPLGKSGKEQPPLLWYTWIRTAEAHFQLGEVQAFNV